jgi:hypothetical protein
MTNIAVAVQAIGLLPAGIEDHAIDHGTMATNAIGHGYLTIERADTQRILHMPGGECLAVVPAIDGFNGIFADEIVRGMTAVAVGHGFVAATIPGVIGITHDMAIEAGKRIIAKIGQAARIDEGQSGKPDQHTQREGHQPSKNYGETSWSGHPRILSLKKRTFDCGF